jgi:hypothetical protein
LLPAGGCVTAVTFLRPPPLPQVRHPVDARHAAVGRRQEARLPGLLRVYKAQLQKVRGAGDHHYRRRRGFHREGTALPAVDATATLALQAQSSSPLLLRMPILISVDRLLTPAAGGGPQAEAQHQILLPVAVPPERQGRPGATRSA